MQLHSNSIGVYNEMQFHYLAFITCDPTTATLRFKFTKKYYIHHTWFLTISQLEQLREWVYRFMPVSPSVISRLTLFVGMGVVLKRNVGDIGVSTTCAEVIIIVKFSFFKTFKRSPWGNNFISYWQLTCDVYWALYSVYISVLHLANHRVRNLAESVEVFSTVVLFGDTVNVRK